MFRYTFSLGAFDTMKLQAHHSLSESKSIRENPIISLFCCIASLFLIERFENGELMSV